MSDLLSDNIADILPYNFSDSERRWGGVFESSRLYTKQSVLDSTKKKYYVLEMFPYPSGKIHMGHVRNYTFGDVIARYKRMRGFNVFHPIGWDAFGLPAENAALERGIHPKEWTLKNIQYMKSQLKKLNLSYNWDVELATCLPEYYSYQQKLFIKLYKAGYVYKKKSLVNWDPVDNCVLANEQVIDGRGWRSGAVVEKRSLEQWFLKITDFSNDLLTDLQTLENWPDKVKVMQENWIGRSEGLTISFMLENGGEIKVFSTRPDTIFGATFVAVSYDHEILKSVAANSAIKSFVDECSKGGISAEYSEKAEKKGLNTGLIAINPVNGKRIPVYIANFVLSGHGYGAVFGCPAHDNRDYEFAKKYGLDIISVVEPVGDCNDKLPYTGNGVLKDSEFLNGLTTAEAKEKIAEVLSERGVAEKETVFKLRDWGISRQRYWGCPIPIVHCEHCGEVVCSDDMLPVLLPDDVTFETVGNPLERHTEWLKVKCPQCGGPARRDSDTMDTFVDSSWYFIGFLKKLFDEDDISSQRIQEWLPVDQYVGGVEHAILHLLYARFITKVLSKELGANVTEPFSSLLTQGMVSHVTYRKHDGSWLYPADVEFTKDGRCIESKSGDEVVVGRSEKMSKSKKNVVDPDEIIKAYGSDSVRLFVVSDTPPDKDFDWTSDGLDGCWRFINRVWRLYSFCSHNGIKVGPLDLTRFSNHNASQLIRKFNVSVKNITDALDNNSFNKAVAYIRDVVNVLYDQMDNINKDEFGIVLGNLAIMISPFMPCLAEEVWKVIHGSDLACLQVWPQYSKDLLVSEVITLPVQINGKLRANIEVPSDADEETVFSCALKHDKIAQFIGDKKIKKSIYVNGKIVNFVI